MNKQDVDEWNGIVMALADAISMMATHVEQTCEGNFKRRQLATVLRDAANRQRGNSIGDQSYATTLEKIASQVAGQ